MKKSITPKTLSVEDMYIEYCKSLLDNNIFYSPKTLSVDGKITRFTKIFYYSNKQINHLNEKIGIPIKDFYMLINEQEDSSSIPEISNIKIGVESLMKKRNELILSAVGEKEIMNYALFKKVLTLYNTKAGEAIIDGEKVDLLCNLGYLSAIRKERSFKTKKPNWGETNKLRDENGELPINEKTGKRKIIYFDTDEWCRVSWFKTNGIQNISIYKFVPSGGQQGKGFRQKFIKENMQNPNLKLKYEYHKLKNYNNDI